MKILECVVHCVGVSLTGTTVAPFWAYWCSALGFLRTVFHDWVSILWGEGTPNDGMREAVWVLGKYPNDAV